MAVYIAILSLLYHKQLIKSRFTYQLKTFATKKQAPVNCKCTTNYRKEACYGLFYQPLPPKSESSCP